MFEKLDSISLMSVFKEKPILDNSKTLLEAGLIEIADKFPPSDPNAPLIAENLAFPLSFSNIKEIASSMFWQFMNTQKNNKKIL